MSIESCPLPAAASKLQQKGSRTTARWIGVRGFGWPPMPNWSKLCSTWPRRRPGLESPGPQGEGEARSREPRLGLPVAWIELDCLSTLEWLMQVQNQMLAVASRDCGIVM